MDSGDESDDEHMSTEMLEDICDKSKYHTDVNKREASCKIRDSINKRELEWKGALKYTRNMDKGLHKVFKTVVKEISQDLSPLGESGSEVSHFIPERRNFSEATKLSDDIKKPWLKKTQKEIENITNNKTFIVEYPEKDEAVTPRMDVYKAKTQSYGSLDKPKLRIVVRGDLQNKELVGDTWSPIASMTTFKHLLADTAKHKKIVHQLDLIGSSLKEKVKNRVFLKLDSRYKYYLPEYSN